MRAVRNFLLVLLTLVLVAVGALLPYGTAAMQDRRMENNSDTRKLSDVQLLIQQDLSAPQVLNLLSGDYTRVAWDSGTNLTESEVKEHAFDAVWLMRLSDLLPESAIDESSLLVAGQWVLELWDVAMNPFLVISNGENREALLLWECTWESPKGAVYTMWIDDAAGTMYGFSGMANSGYADGGKAEKYLNLYMDRWAFFLSSYYEFEIVDEISTKGVSDDGLRNTLALTLEFQDTEDTPGACTVQLIFTGDHISFLC